jgi:ureidoacrylate peracid hydrolase
MSAGAAAAALPWAQELEPARCALVVVDMQNDFCAPGGYIDKIMGKDVAGAAAVVPVINALVEQARRAGVPVIWIGADYSFDRIPASMLRKVKARGITVECCKPGTWGAQWFGVSPAPGEAVVYKHNYAGFTGTPLKDVLREKGVQTLVFTGVQTQICVESSVREAHALGYTVVVARDGVGSHTPPAHEASLANVQFLFGEVCAAQDILNAWR